jgi:hypothetical protein
MVLRRTIFWIAAASGLGLNNCALPQQSLGEIQQSAIAECEVSSPGKAFADCYKFYVQQHQAALRKITPQEDKADFILGQYRVPH